MNETIRSVVFIGLAAVVAVAAWASRPRLIDENIPENVGMLLFPEFKEPTAAKSLEIRQYDEATARQDTFKVAQQPSGRWVIPSHGDYPADATEQMKAAAESVMQLKTVGHTKATASDHAMYGVLDPEKASPGEQGYGTLISIQDAKGDDLLRLIVGKEVEGQPELRFVRKPSQEAVYVTKIDLSKLPPQFDKWIEKDLLKVKAFDVAKVLLKDYVLVRSQSGPWGHLPRMEATLAYHNEKGEWSLEKMSTFTRDGRPRETGLSDHEELNKQRLDDLRSALADLKIVDVIRKPEGLGSSLRVSSELLDGPQTDSLRQYGFIPVPAADGKVDIFATNGEVHFDTMEGVQYVLRFGDIAPRQETTPSPTTNPDGTPQEDEVKVSRYLFVTTRLSPTMLPPPELEPEPAGPETPATDEPAGDAKADDAKQGDAKAEGDKDGGKKESTAVDPQATERERVKRENERKLNEYRDKKKKAEARVAELNARFADWYYIVNEDVYKKIRLVRSDFVKEGTSASEEGFGVDAFRKLEQEGPDGAPPAPATPAAPATPGFPPGFGGPM